MNGGRLWLRRVMIVLALAAGLVVLGALIVGVSAGPSIRVSGTLFPNVNSNIGNLAIIASIVVLGFWAAIRTWR